MALRGAGAGLSYAGVLQGTPLAMLLLPSVQPLELRWLQWGYSTFMPLLLCSQSLDLLQFHTSITERMSLPPQAFCPPDTAGLAEGISAGTCLGFGIGSKGN